MANASQRHKLEVRGYDSLGGRKALFKVMSNSGTDSRQAVIELFGRWSATDTIRVTTNVGAGNVNTDYSPSGDETAEAAATGFAAAINLVADHNASATGNRVLITKTTAGNLDVVDTLFV